MAFNEAFERSVQDEQEKLMRQIQALGIKVPEDREQRARFSRYVIGMKRPGIKALMGQNPLSEMDDDIEKYFKLKRERA